MKHVLHIAFGLVFGLCIWGAFREESRVWIRLLDAFSAGVMLSAMLAQLVRRADMRLVDTVKFDADAARGVANMWRNLGAEMMKDALALSRICGMTEKTRAAAIEHFRKEGRPLPSSVSSAKDDGAAARQAAEDLALPQVNVKSGGEG